MNNKKRLKLCVNCRYYKDNLCVKHIKIINIDKPNNTTCSLWKVKYG